MNDDDKMIIEISPNVFMPRLAFGTYKLKGEDCRRALRKALEVGYEHIDTASIYKNENEIGEVLEEWMMKHENENENENGQNKKKKKKKMPFLASKIAPAEMHSQLFIYKLYINYIVILAYSFGFAFFFFQRKRNVFGLAPETKTWPGRQKAIGVTNNLERLFTDVRKTFDTHTKSSSNPVYSTR